MIACISLIRLQYNHFSNTRSVVGVQCRLPVLHCGEACVTDIVSGKDVIGSEQCVARPYTGIWAALVADDRRAVARLDRACQPTGRLAATTASSSTARSCPGGIWAVLRQRVDPTCYCPQAIPGIVEEQVCEGNQTYTVLRSPAGMYIRLTPAERALWHAMDGSRTMAQLATLGFVQFRQLLPVADLVQTLKRQGFLVDPHVAVYTQLQEALERRTTVGWGRRLLIALSSHTLAFKNIDGCIRVLYRYGGWIFFTPLFLLLMLMVSIGGLVAFIRIARLDYPVHAVLAVDAIPTSLLALWAALLVSFSLHELAHALAVKHYGRQIWRGGLMLYYGMPVAFVDTSDIWLAGRRARMVVSAAGPLSDLLVGGAAALYVTFFPATPLSGAAYKLAVACYVATLFNLNPLLELDGYYLLVDALRQPNLRQRALNFVSGSLWEKVRARAPFSAEERMLGFYGLLTLVYTICAIILAFLFWQRQLVLLLPQLWVSGWGGQLVALLIMGGFVAPIMIGSGLALWGGLRGCAAWIARRGYARRPVYVVALLLLLVGVLTWLPLHPASPSNVTAVTGAVAPLLWLVALLALLTVWPDYRGADVWRVLQAMLGAGLLTFLALVGRMVSATDGGVFWIAVDGLALLLLMLAGFAALLDVDLHQASQRELGMIAFLLFVAFGWGGMAIYLAQMAWPSAAFGVVLAIAAPVYCGALALALLLPHLSGLRDSRLIWSWFPLWVAIGVQTGTYVLRLIPDLSTTTLIITLDILTAGLWMVAWYTHYVTLRTFAPQSLNWPSQPALDEAQRLQRGFQLTYAGCYQLLRTVYGARRAQALDDRLDILAATANWDVTLDRDQARIGATLAASPLDRQGARYAEVLRYTIATIEEIAGRWFARRTIQAAYDALPWAEREATDRQCFPHIPWASDLSHAFGCERAARQQLLRQVDLFLTGDDADLSTLSHALQPIQVRAGATVADANAIARGIWIVEAGEIAVWEGATIVDELHRGEVFGAMALIASSDASPGQVAHQPVRTGQCYRATVDSTVLFLPWSDWQHFVQTRSPGTVEGIEIFKVLQLLERVPLFAEVPRQTLRHLARVAQRREVPARTIIIRENVYSETFYLIQQGTAAVIKRRPALAAMASMPRSARMVARLGTGEFFGELELLRGVPPVASVVALTPMVLLALPDATIRELLLTSDRVAQRMEQVGSGRLWALREQQKQW